MSALAYLALGSNIEPREHYLDEALRFLSTILIIKRKSFIYETKALLKENAPDVWNQPFLNAVIATETTMSAHELFVQLQTIETAMGRLKEDASIWSPRVIDIDILTYADDVIDTQTLTIPHANLCQRDFVLLPLSEIAPKWSYPVKGPYHGYSAKELYDSCLKNYTPTILRQYARPLS